MFQSTGIKTVLYPSPPLLCGSDKCRTLSLSGIAPSFFFLFVIPFFLFPDFSFDAVQRGTVFLISMLPSGFPVYRGGHFQSDAYLRQVDKYELLDYNKRAAKGYSRRPGKISTICDVVFLRSVTNTPSLMPHDFLVSSNSYNHTAFGRRRLKKSPHRYESHRTTYK